MHTLLLSLVFFYHILCGAVYLILISTALVIVKSVCDSVFNCLRGETEATPGHILQPVHIALQDGDPNTGWRPFEKGAEYVQLALDIVLSGSSTCTQVNMTLTVSDIFCHRGDLVVYYQISNVTEEEWGCGQAPDMQECAFVSHDDGGHKCTFSCHRWCYRDYVRVFTLFQKLRWMPLDPVVLDLSVELVW